MKELYRDFLFQKHILVNYELLNSGNNPLDVYITLAQKFGILLKKNPTMAAPSMIHDAERCLGYYVPEPFYRGFPGTVRELTPDQLLYDQLRHYTMTYGYGWFEQALHSEVEEYDEKRTQLNYLSENKDLPPKFFDILPEDEAYTVLKDAIKDLLASNRPLNPGQQQLVEEAWRDFATDILPEKMPCKATVVQLLYTFKDLTFCRFLMLSDVIKLLNYIQWSQYHSENLKKLNLRNQDRKLITNVIDRFFDQHQQFIASSYYGYNHINEAECHEKKKIWCGLLHHIHYQPKTESARFFVDGIRSNVNKSSMALVERYISESMIRSAAITLMHYKGHGALVRNLNYLLSRCKTDEEVKEVLSCLE